MRKLVVLTFATLLLAACGGETEKTNNDTNNQEQPNINTDVVTNPMTAEQPEADPNDPNLPILSFEKEMHEFPGTITEGESVSYSFKFTNTGKSDLVISDANAPCGCTIPSYSKEPIPPGGSGQIDVVYNSENRGGGRHEKSVRITSNSIPKVKELRIVVNVNPKNPQ